MLLQYDEIMLTLPAIKQVIQKFFNAKEALAIKLALNMRALNLRNYGKTA
jgi:hypothetical protein